MGGYPLLVPGPSTRCHAGGGCYPAVWSHVRWDGGYPPVWSHVRWVGGGLPPSGPMLGGREGLPLRSMGGPPVDRQTENITFPHTPCVGGNKRTDAQRRSIVVIRSSSEKFASDSHLTKWQQTGQNTDK